MRFKKGGILLYALTLFLSVILFLEGFIIEKVKQEQRLKYHEMIEARLDLQNLILSTYRKECDFDQEEDDDQDDFEKELVNVCELNLSFDDSTYLIRADAIHIEVFNEHGISILKYDIMGDGSVIETITEETK